MITERTREKMQSAVSATGFPSAPSGGRKQHIRDTTRWNTACRWLPVTHLQEEPRLAPAVTRGAAADETEQTETRRTDRGATAFFNYWENKRLKQERSWSSVFS